MMILRDPNSTPQRPGHETGPCDGRLNLLLSYADLARAPEGEQLRRLLEPLGISSYLVGSGEEAEHLLRELAIHIAVVDWAIPLRRNAARYEPAGARILQLLGRLDTPPPTVIVRPPQPKVRESTRGLSEALRAGAFAVLDQPVALERLLEVLRRILRRHYRDCWPDGPPGSSPPSTSSS
jgi:DNA-binding response OmpR family regulator